MGIAGALAVLVGAGALTARRRAMGASHRC
ncbi:MAG: hypothetical protein FWD74_11975 [Actinomycetia bacterium]|nr:hypothetical protein [Actinomycetes bacterium]